MKPDNADLDKTPSSSASIRTVPVWVVNLAGFNYSRVYVRHARSTLAPIDQIDASFPAESFVKGTVRIDGDGGDFWELFAYQGDDVKLSAIKICGVEPSDADSKVPVFLVFHSLWEGYSVILPNSSSCILNRYRETPR